MTPELHELASSGASTAKIHDAAAGAGMRPILQVALEAVQVGDTTLEEVHRVVGDPEAEIEEHPAGPVVAETAAALAAGAAAEPRMERDEESGGRAVHVLVVDDEPTNRTFARALLEQAGYRVTEAEDGLKALQQLDSGAFDLLLLDLEMPKLGGWEVLSQVRRQVPTATLPVVVFTAVADPDSESQLLERGADDYLRKPIDARRFIARVNATLRRTSAHALEPR